MRGADDVIAFEGGWEAIGRGLSAAGGATDNCFTNFRTVQQLASFVGVTREEEQCYSGG